MNDLQWNDKNLEQHASEYEDSRSAPVDNHKPASSPAKSSFSPSCSHNMFSSEDRLNDIGSEARKASPYGTPRKSPEHIKKLAAKIRYWESVKTPNKSFITSTNGLTFLVMSYNILAQTLLENHIYLYRDCMLEALSWSYRFDRIYNEIITMNPDIICLQEVQNSHLKDIMFHLDKLGYKSIFKQKTGSREDGCAIFFKNSMFEIVDYHSVEFLQPGITLLNRDNIGLMAKLRPKSLPHSQFIVCTTHLLYNPRRNDVRLAQMQVFLAEIDRFSFHPNGATHLPIILTGDLNSLPNSPVTSLIADGNYNIDTDMANLHSIEVTNACQHLGVYLQRCKKDPSQDFKLSMLYHSEIKESYKRLARNMDQATKDYGHLFDNSFIRHNLNFKSVYRHTKENGEEEATTHQNGWVTVDYIYYTACDTLDIQECFRLPTVDECIEMGAIPNSCYGSDHLSLAAKFILLDAPLQLEIPHSK